MSRKTDLEQGIRESYQLIEEYQSIARTSSDPKERVRCEKAIEEQWNHIRGYLDEYRPLVGDDLSEDITDIAAHFARPPSLRSTQGGTQSVPTGQKDRGHVISWLKKLPVGAQVTLLVSILTLIVTCVGWFVIPAVEHWIENRRTAPTSAGTDTPAGDYFFYYVRVQAKDKNEYVENADVSIEIAGRAPLRAATDSNGYAMLQVPSSHAEQPGRLTVEKTGYKRHEETITLTKDALPRVVELELAP
jgi:hypothetical protein